MLLHCCRWTCIANGIFPNNDSLCTWRTLCAIPELAVVWVARWGEGRGLRSAHFAVWHTDCGWTFRWDWGIGEITETQFRRQQRRLCLLSRHQNQDCYRKWGPYFSNLPCWVGEWERAVCDYFSLLITEHSGWPFQLTPSWSREASREKHTNTQHRAL